MSGPGLDQRQAAIAAAVLTGRDLLDCKVYRDERPSASFTESVLWASTVPLAFRLGNLRSSRRAKEDIHLYALEFRDTRSGVEKCPLLITLVTSSHYIASHPILRWHNIQHAR